MVTICDVYELQKNTLDQLISVQDRLSEVETTLLELPGLLERARAKVMAVLDIFQTAEYLGWGESFSPQITIDELPPGFVIEASLEVPTNERWYWILCLYGDCPSSATALGYSYVSPFTEWGRVKNSILLHEGWIGRLVCPYGLKAVKEGTSFDVCLANLTASVSSEMDAKWNLNRFVSFAQKRVGANVPVSLSGTLFFFRIHKKYFEKFDKLVGEVLGE